MSTLEAMVEQCEHCNTQLEIGQIGLCDDCSCSDDFTLTPSPVESAVDPRFDEDGEQVQFTFDELSESAKDKVRGKEREHATDYEWWDGVYEDTVSIGSLLGIYIGQRRTSCHNGKSRYDTNIYFQGFSYQGDGCCYSGDLQIAQLKGCVARLREHTGVGCTDDVLFKLAAEGEAIYQTVMLRLLELKMQGVDIEDLDDNTDTVEIALNSQISIKGTDHYWSTKIDFDGMAESLEDAMNFYVSSFADWIYASLEAEHDHLTSDETIDDQIRQNEMIFDSEGVEV